jgi:hypothetical protein
MGAHSCGAQVVRQFTQWLLPGADHDVVHLDLAFVGDLRITDTPLGPPLPDIEGGTVRAGEELADVEADAAGGLSPR